MRTVGSADDAAEREPCCQGAIAAMLTPARATAATTRYRCLSASARSAAARSSTTYWRRNTVAGSNTQLTRSRKPAAVTTASNPTRMVTPRRICVVVSHSGIEWHRRKLVFGAAFRRAGGRQQWSRTARNVSVPPAPSVGASDVERQSPKQLVHTGEAALRSFLDAVLHRG